MSVGWMGVWIRLEVTYPIGKVRGRVGEVAGAIIKVGREGTTGDSVNIVSGVIYM